MKTYTQVARSMSGLKIKFLAVLLAIVFAPSICGAADIYIAQSSAGAANGSSCANALAWNAWTNAGNWTPGNTLHICGTYSAPTVNTSAIQALSSGSSGSPITIKFEPNAVLSSGAWGAPGAINVNDKSFITIDGGTNGKIQNTANGDVLANQISSAGIQCPDQCNNATVQNLTITSLYIKVQGTSDGTTICGLSGSSTCPNDDSVCIGLISTNLLITRNSLDHCATGIGAANSDHHEISFNTLSFMNHAITDGTSGTVANDIKIHDNDIGGGGYLWDNATHNYHHNGIIILNEGVLGPNVTNLQIYNNYFHGTWSEFVGGGTTTAAIFIDDYPVTQTGHGGQAVAELIFNNVISFDAPDTGVANAFINSGWGGATIANNTIVVPTGAAGGTCLGIMNVAATFAYNNICSGNLTPVAFKGSGPALAKIDYNLYYLTAGNAWFMPDSGGFFNASGWQALGLDTHSLISVGSPNLDNPKLNSNGTLGVGSPAVGAGTNLTGMGIAMLDLDKVGAPRVSTGAWAVGAFASSSNSNLNPATGLAGTGH